MQAEAVAAQRPQNPMNSRSRNATTACGAFLIVLGTLGIILNAAQAKGFRSCHWGVGLTATLVGAGLIGLVRCWFQANPRDPSPAPPQEPVLPPMRAIPPPTAIRPVPRPSIEVMREHAHMIRQRLIDLLKTQIDLSGKKDDSPAEIMKLIRWKPLPPDGPNIPLLQYLFYLEMDPTAQPQSREALEEHISQLRQLAVHQYCQAHKDLADIVFDLVPPAEQLAKARRVRDNLRQWNMNLPPGTIEGLIQILEGPAIAPPTRPATAAQLATLQNIRFQVVALLHADFDLKATAENPTEVLGELREEFGEKSAAGPFQVVRVYFFQYLLYLRLEPRLDLQSAQGVEEQIDFLRRWAVRICRTMEHQIAGLVREEMTTAEQREALASVPQNTIRPLNPTVMRLLPQILGGNPAPR